ncbi:MAG: hypothetical protein U0353_14380 [Sandaracinus sp.]
MQGGFGQPPGGGGGFGQPPGGGGGFGAPPGGGGFGAPPAGGGGFGAPPGGGGGFGAPPGGGGGFGAPPPGNFGQQGGGGGSGFGPPPAGGPSVGAPPPAPGAPPPAGGGEGEPNNVGLILAGIWLTLGVLGCLGTGVAGAMSESMGVNVSYLGIPMFFGGLGAISVAPFVRTKGTGAAIGAPIGCGCGGFIMATVLVGVFYAAIWPSL